MVITDLEFVKREKRSYWQFSVVFDIDGEAMTSTQWRYFRDAHKVYPPQCRQGRSKFLNLWRNYKQQTLERIRDEVAQRVEVRRATEEDDFFVTLYKALQTYTLDEIRSWRPSFRRDLISFCKTLQQDNPLPEFSKFNLGDSSNASRR